MQDGGPLWTKRVGVSRPSAVGLGRVFHSGRLDLPSEPAHPPVLASPASTVHATIKRRRPATLISTFADAAWCRGSAAAQRLDHCPSSE